MTIIILILLAICGFFTFYLVFLTVMGFFYKSKIIFPKQKQFNNKQDKKCFAIIVPAHNEEEVIALTLANLNKINYPKDLFHIFVIADNCTDQTFIRATKMGAIVLERENKNYQGKGYALNWCFKLLQKSPIYFDAFLVIDADTVVSENILHVLNVYLNNGHSAIQCADLVKPEPGIWSSEITRIGLYLYNYVRPLGRKMINCSAGLRGNGMCFNSDLLKKVPWQAYSQTEDLEYGLTLLLNGIHVTFAPEAKVYAVMPANSKNAESQRARWEFGRFPIVKKYSSLLFKEAIKNKSFKIFDFFIELVTPAFVNLFLVTVIMLVLNLIFNVVNIIPTNTYLLLWTGIFLLQIFYVLSGLYLAQADANAYKALWHAPQYIVWKVILYFKTFLKGHTKMWIRTPREEISN